MESKRSKQPMKVMSKIILGVAGLTVVGFSIFILIVTTVVYQMVYDTSLAQVKYESEFRAYEISAQFQRSAALVDTLGDVLAHVPAELATPIIADFLARYEHITDAYVGLNDDRLLDWEGLFDIPGFYSTQRPWFVSGRSANGAVTMSDPYLSAAGVTGGELAVAVVRYVPTILNMGGVVAANFDMQSLNHLLDQQTVAGSYSILLNQDALVVAYPDQSFAPTTTPAGDTVLSLLWSSPVYASLQQEFMAGNRAISFRNATGELHYFLAFPIESVGWTLVSVVPASAVTGPAVLTVLTVLGWAAAILGVVMAGIVFMINRMVKKSIKLAVDSFESQSQALARGESLPRSNQRPDSSFGLNQLDIAFAQNLEIMAQLIGDISTMHESHLGGFFHESIDSRAYSGAFATIATSINDMVRHHTDAKTQILDCIAQIVGGDFDASLPQYPGDEAYINQAIEGLRGNIREIARAIGEIATHAQQGDVSYALDPTRYKGEWVGLIQELNAILTAIATPLKATNAVLVALEQGDFDQRVSGEFAGEFLVIKDAINATTSAIASYITEINQVLSLLSVGDLRQRIERDYIGQFASIKASINTIVHNQAANMGEIAIATESVNTAAEQISGSSASLAEGASNQSQTLAQLTQTLATIDTRSQSNVQAAQDGADLVQTASHTARAGNTEMDNLLATMNNITTSSGKISVIIKTIEDIAFQTNLLALNAAVEAARAGEHGRGFAVVAEEVRTLASRSADAAKETADLIQESITHVNVGMTRANDTAATFEQIVSSVANVATVMDTILQASHEQTSAITQASQGLAQVSDVTATNASTSEEVAATSQELNAQAELLREKVAVFRF